jgi:hypothetical protein
MLWTLREMALYSEGVRKREREEFRQQITIAHLGAALRRAKKLPRLASLLPRESRELTAKARRAHITEVMRGFAGEGETKKKRKK